MNRALLAVYIVLAVNRPTFAAEAWPAIENVEASFDIDWRAPRIDVDLPIRNKQGAAVYRFICRGGADQAKVDALSEGPHGINYVSPLMCVLNKGDQETEASLLGEAGDGGPWHTRGQFHHSELGGACAAYPQYGRVRTFRLRGFEFTLDLSDTQVNGNRAVRSKMKVSAISKPDITSDIEPSGYADPQRGNCSKVVRYAPSAEEIAREKERARDRAARMLAKP
jgi:hypothetical protein